MTVRMVPLYRCVQRKEWVFLTWQLLLKTVVLLLSGRYLAKEDPNRLRDTSGVAQWAGTVLKSKQEVGEKEGSAF